MKRSGVTLEMKSLVKDEVVQANRGDKRQLSSGSSTLSNSKEKKKTKLGSLGEKATMKTSPMLINGLMKSSLKPIKMRQYGQKA